MTQYIFRQRARCVVFGLVKMVLKDATENFPPNEREPPIFTVI